MIAGGSSRNLAPPQIVPTSRREFPLEDFKPASSNQGGKEYPRVNSERRVRFRIAVLEALAGP